MIQNKFPITLVLFLMPALCAVCGCTERPPQYGTEASIASPLKRRQVWAVAPAVNLSGIRGVDPLLQADLLFQQLQQVKGVTAIPVNRVAEVYASLRIDKVQSQEQAAIVCDLLGCDGLLVPTVTIYDPYDPPKFGASLQLFGKSPGHGRPATVDPRELTRRATPGENESLPPPVTMGAVPFAQAVGLYDAANGSVREQVASYAAGRHDPVGAMGGREYLADMDRYCGFAYHMLIRDLLFGLKSAKR